MTKIFHTIVGICILLTGIQIGIYHGRKMQLNEDINKISDAEKRADRLGSMLSIAMDTLGKMQEIKHITLCESGGRHDNIWGDNGKSYGHWQFKKTTFEELSQKVGLEWLDWKNRDHQTIIGAWAITNGYKNLWTCANKN